MRQTTEMAVQWSGVEFEEKVVSSVPVYFAREPWASASHEMSNGWWVHVNLNADTIRQACMAVVEAAEISDEDDDIEPW